MCASGTARAGVLVGIVAAGAILLIAGIVLSRPAPIEQPLAFDHALHTEELGAYCTDCHLYVERGLRATIPNVDVCSDCHYDEPLTDSEAEAWLVEQVESDSAIPWRKLYRVPDHVFFSHRRHTAVAGIECETCHGPIATRDEPPSRPLREITMEGCMQCHRESGASNDCIACHV